MLTMIEIYGLSIFDRFITDFIGLV